MNVGKEIYIGDQRNDQPIKILPILIRRNDEPHWLALNVNLHPLAVRDILKVSKF